MARQTDTGRQEVPSLPPRAEERLEGWVQRYPKDFESEYISHLIRDLLQEDEQLSMLLDAAERAREAADARDAHSGKTEVNVENVSKAVGRLDYEATQRSLEIVAEACATASKHANTKHVAGEIDADERVLAIRESQAWLKTHTNEAERAGVDY